MRWPRWPAADPLGFEAYREQRRPGRTPSRPIGTCRAATAGAVARQSAAVARCAAELDARARITWFGPPMSAMSHATARLMETWAHGQDVLEALELERPTRPLEAHRTSGRAHASVQLQQHGLTPPDDRRARGAVAPGGAVWTWGDPAVGGSGPRLGADFCLSWSSAATWTTRTWSSRVRTPANGC